MPRLTRSQRLLLCTAAAAVLFLFRLGGPALWEPDEGRYAEVARAMVASGDYVTPRDNVVRYFEKPPLVYWASAASISLFGRDEFAVRLPAALASIGSVTATAAAGELMLGPAAGMLAGLALALSPLFFLFARVATPDPELAVFFSAALFAFYLAAMRGFARGTGRLLMALAAAMLAFATLAKGPVAPLLAGAIGMGWLVVERRARDALRIRWLECIAIYLLITVPWFVLVARRNPGFVEFFLVHEHLHRFVSDTEHGWGPWFFIPVAIAGTWPFFYFIPAGISDLYNSPDRARQSAVHFLAIWFLIILIFFSIPRAKLAEYLLPGLPPLAVLAAAGLERVRKMAQ
jgi:4-amino-4-deoxy-L-arabinose transferase-like glycosyltransferase